MKLSLVSLALLLVPAAALADSWSGTYTETVVSTNDPSYSVGQSVTESYAYATSGTSPDGAFYGAANGNPQYAGDNTTLTGNMYLFQAPDDGGSPSLENYLLDAEDPDDAILTVQNDEVVGLHVNLEWGYNSIEGDGLAATVWINNYYSARDQAFLNYQTDIALAFSNPVDVSRVPEEGSVALLLGAGLLLIGGIAFGRARTRRTVSGGRPNPARSRRVSPLVAAVATAFVGFAPAALADTYSGTLVETITSSNDPYIPVGTQYIGSYAYQSSTGINGDFYGTAPSNPDSLPYGQMTGTYYGPSDDEIYSLDPLPLGETSSYPATEMIVENGAVTNGFVA